MTDIAPFDAILLAGGKSTRFGSDKAFADWRGQLLYERQLEKLRSLGADHIWISVNRDQEFRIDDPGVSIVVDDKPDLGPVGGLVSALGKSTAKRVVVLGVDLPLMEADFLRCLLEDDTPTVPKTGEFWEPLVAVYPTKLFRDLLEGALSRGERKLQHILDEAKDNGLISERPVADSEKVLFTNLNSARDLSAIDPNRSDHEIQLRRFRLDSGFTDADDYVAAEEPLEVQVNGQSVSVMMRTPGHDEELATGFLFTESVIDSADDIREMRHLEDLDRASTGNTLEVSLQDTPDLSGLTRHVFTSSSCGVCGKATIDSVFQQFPPIEVGEPFPPDLILTLPDRLRSAQKTFDRTGGLHASALFSRKGEMIVLREDVGRHNALDKVIGFGLREKIDFSDVILLVSGRISFELMQKALSVKIPAVAGISAPSSLAVKLAKESGQTLVGFLRGKGFNLYSGTLA